MEQIILVDESDNPIGTAEKLQAHIDGKLHRAFSIFVFNSKNELLLQRRALDKYHSGGLWTNTCCSHPRPGETTLQAAHRRLKEEMGFDCTLAQLFSFIYQTSFDNGLQEHEYDHVITGDYSGSVYPNPTEVAEHKWISLAELQKDISKFPLSYTYWLQICLPRLIDAKTKAKSESDKN